MKATVGEICSLVGGRILKGCESAELRNFAGLDQADPSCVSFYSNPKYRALLASTQAGLILVSDPEIETSGDSALILVENPVIAFDFVIRKFGIGTPQFSPGVSEFSFVHPEARVNPENVSIAPNATVLAGAVIGSGTRIGAGAVIGEGAVIGADCEIGPNATVSRGCMLGDRVIVHPGAVIGADGFGFEFSNGRHYKIEQMGIVSIGDDVEVGASTTIDRARFGMTVIGEGTKIDNQVQIGHNCIIGKHCIIVAQCGISGSSRIGDYVTLAAQSGVAGHITIADGVKFGGRSGAISSIREPGGEYMGYPARPFKEERREAMRIKQLGNLLKRVKNLEAQIGGGDSGD